MSYNANQTIKKIRQKVGQWARMSSFLGEKVEDVADFHRFTVIPTPIRNYIHYKVWDKSIINPQTSTVQRF